MNLCQFGSFGRTCGGFASPQEATHDCEVSALVPVPVGSTVAEQAAHVAAAIKDPELRELALRVMIKDLALKKGAREGP